MGGARVKVNGVTAKIGKKPKVIDAKDSPHYQKRGDMRAISEAEGARLVKEVTEARNALERSKKAIAGGLQPLRDGLRIGLRPQLNVLKQTGKLVQTIHSTEEKKGKGEGKKQMSITTSAAKGQVLGYVVAGTVRNAMLNVSQSARARIALGLENKTPMSSVDGNYVAKPSADMFDGIEVRFNPKRVHLYVDPDGRPVKSAEEATVVGTPDGPRVFVRGKIEYFDESDYPQPLRDAPTEVELAAA